MATKYTRATVDIFFDPDHVACNFCPLLETDRRNMCRKTGEYIVDPRVTVGSWCPLQIEDLEVQL